MKFIDMFSDGQYPSWTRIMGTPIILCAIYSFIYSIQTKYDNGLMYSVALVTLILGAKSYQNHTETIFQEKMISEANSVTEEGK